MAEVLERNTEVGARLKALRKARRKTQPAVADAVGVSLRAYQTWEAGHNAISWPHLEKVSGVLGVTPEYLLHGDAQPLDRASVGTQLDRIEAMLTELLARFTDADAAAVEAELDAAPLPADKPASSTARAGRAPRRASRAR